MLVPGFDAVAPALASWRDEGLLVRSVPDAWWVEDGIWRASALFYFERVDRFATSVTPFSNSRAPLLGEGRRLNAAWRALSARTAPPERSTD